MVDPVLVDLALRLEEKRQQLRDMALADAPEPEADPYLAALRAFGEQVQRTRHNCNVVLGRAKPDNQIP